MKFTYLKREPLIVHPEDSGDTHEWSLEDSTFTIYASKRGVYMSGKSPIFQPVDEERKIPEDFRQFFTRLADAFEFAFKEQEKARKESDARKMLLGG